jgi:3-polyprenyl-4-hydroxybenzoate decarboxylase
MPVVVVSEQILLVQMPRDIVRQLKLVAMEVLGVEHMAFVEETVEVDTEHKATDLLEVSL